MQIIITVVAWSLCVRVYLCVSVAKTDKTIKMLFVAWTRGSARNQSWVPRSPPGQGALGGGARPGSPRSIFSILFARSNSDAASVAVDVVVKSYKNIMKYKKNMHEISNYS